MGIIIENRQLGDKHVDVVKQGQQICQCHRDNKI